MLLEVVQLTKHYPTFSLENVSFQIPRGYITGLIGRNGAGKTTTLKCMLNLVHADGGSVRVAGLDYQTNELQLKQHLGVVFGSSQYYLREPLARIAAVTKRFYPAWDDAAFSAYLRAFKLDPKKKMKEFSDGMRLKALLALALSHGAELLILDEPTSGLDPVSRDELIDIFRRVVEDGKRSILFSTHITSDLEKCADFLVYLQNGRVTENGACCDILENYRLLKGGTALCTHAEKARLIGLKQTAYDVSALVRTEDLPLFAAFHSERISLETLMIYKERA